MTWEPSLTCSFAIATQVSQSSASIASRNFFEPLALVRSPMMTRLDAPSRSPPKDTGE